jgi:hypothetical protein
MIEVTRGAWIGRFDQRAIEPIGQLNNNIDGHGLPTSPLYIRKDE